MNQTIQFQFESVASTTTADFQLPGTEKQQTSTSASVNLVVPDSLSSLPRSACGKLPRLAISAANERLNTQLRSRMQDARVRLGEDVFGDAPKTLASVRLSLGYSQQQLATAIGTSQPAIAKLEAGSINIFWDTGRRLSQALGLTLSELDEVILATSKLSASAVKV